MGEVFSSGPFTGTCAECHGDGRGDYDEPTREEVEDELRWAGFDEEHRARLTAWLAEDAECGP